MTRGTSFSFASRAVTVLSLAAVASIAICGGVHAAPLFDVDVRIEPARGTHALAIVQALDPVRSTRHRVLDCLVVSCPTRESRLWRTTIRVGDTLALDWRSRGGRGTLSVPDAGWVRPCACDGRPGRRPAVLVGEFLDASGRMIGRQVETRGASGLGRAATLGLRRGPRPPARVRIRCGWGAETARPATSWGTGAGSRP